MSQIPPITTGLGKFTPEVWSRMSDSIYTAEELSGKTSPQRRVAEPNPVTFPARITGYFLKNETGNPTQETSNPRRRYYYSWEEVSVNFTIPTGLSVTKFDGARESGTPGDSTFIPGVNGSEFGQPTDRSSCMLGVNLDLYPENVAVMPSIHEGQPISDSGVVNSAQTGDGPVVMLTLLRCTIDVNGEGEPTPEGQFRNIAFFYSAINVDGPCDA